MSGPFSTPLGRSSEHIAELEDDIVRLADDNDLLRARVAELSDALHAAVDGELAPAEAFAAAGALGMRELEPGAAVISLEQRSIPPHSEHDTWIEHRFRLPPNIRHVLIRRLYVEPAIAPHFRMISFEQNRILSLLGGGPYPEAIPCELFTKRYGSPRFDWRFDDSDDVAVRVSNISSRTLHFRMLMLGCWMEGRKPQ